jgi:ABC-type transporter MlaC component
MPKKNKKVKDPNRPKRSLSAYFLFAADFRGKYAGDKVSTVEMAKKCGEEWKQQSEKSKKPFVEAAKKSRKAYLKALEKYKKQQEKTKPPKRPLSAFFLFMQKTRPVVKERMPNAPVQEISKEMGSIWRNMSDDEKKPFLDDNATLKANYAGERARWEKKMRKQTGAEAE